MVGLQVRLPLVPRVRPNDPVLTLPRPTQEQRAVIVVAAWYARLWPGWERFLLALCAAGYMRGARVRSKVGAPVPHSVPVEMAAED